MKLEYRKLTDQELSDGLAALDGWSIENGQLVHEFAFDQYQQGLVFASAVGYLADQMDHHPDLFIGYRKVSVKVDAHSVEGLSPYDLELARRINAICLLEG